MTTLYKNVAQPNGVITGALYKRTGGVGTGEPPVAEWIDENGVGRDVFEPVTPVIYKKRGG
jgi:hypothetical protein